MKKVTKLTGILGLLILGCSSCQKIPAVNPATTAIVQQGKWIVSRLSSSGTDVTSRFSGFKITFNANGTATATSNTSTITGSWSVVNDDDENEKKIIMNFGETDPFDKLSDDWHIVTETPDSISLEHSGGDHDSSDSLTIEKD